MKDFLILPFRIALKEIKNNNQFKKELSRKDSKVAFAPFIYMNYMFLIMYSIIYIALIYLVIVGIFFTPLAFISLVTTSLFLWIATLLHKKLYPKTRENYLKSIGFYKKH